MGAPSLVASYVLHSPASDTTPLTTPSFIPSNNELILAKLLTWSNSQPALATTGGGQSFGPAHTSAPGGFFGYARADSCIVDTSLIGGDGSMVVSNAGTAANSHHSMVVERWSPGSTIGAVNGVISGANSLPQAAVVTTKDSSVISACWVDENSKDPATRTYLLGSTVEEAIWDGHVGTNSVFYFIRAPVGVTGSYVIGATAPDLQQWNMVAVEIVSSGGGPVGWAPKVNRHATVRVQKTVAGNTNYVKRRPVVITGFAADTNPRLRVRHTGEVYGNASVGVVRKTSTLSNAVGQYESW